VESDIYVVGALPDRDSNRSEGMNNNFTMEYLKELQSYPLDLKISLTKARIREWINKFGIEGVYISFSGGKDSTVLLDIVRGLYPEIEAVFVDVPTQYPELKEFVKTFDNVTILKPKINFAQVCKKYGFPLISKEVSESVEGARKYLTQVINKYDALTDRQTDRQTDR
jgi:3'-phosphoadenosine 5'-phosphosulfate sulfotransferase (PAPS reductase)/FAD synthetase